ncbi:MAG: hypothetical protein J6W82_00305 [Bacteroidales bacterium]|nr:hypothetical protein [Bacteroidales bacterium]
MEYGLIGARLGHSFSREIHSQLSQDPYELRELAPEQLPAFLKAREFKGINVTIPYKKMVMPFLDELDDSARSTGAVNTIVNKGGRLIGYNTDYYGFIALARHAGVDFQGARLVILGAGGAACAVVAAAKAMGVGRVRYAVRRPGGEGFLQIADTQSYSDAEIIVNATPVGMFPDWQGCPVDLGAFPGLRGVLDCVYNPLRTRLVLDARNRGVPAEGGLMMLVAQAVRAREFCTGDSFPDDVCNRLHEGLLRRKRNLVLLGMPSCGKSTVGREIASRCDRRFVDIDEVISLQAGMEIPDIFAREGEEGFRKRETVAIESVAAEQGLVIATGGGAVLRDENLRLLRHNGILCLLERDLELLTPTSDRPLSRDREALRALWEKRSPFYLRAADVRIDNNGALESTIEELMRYVD